MKNKIAAVLGALLLMASLTACGTKNLASGGNAYASRGNAYASYGNVYASYGNASPGNAGK